MISAFLAIVGPLLLPAVGGILSGIGINVVGLLTSGAGKVAVNVVPLAVRLALRILNDDEPHTIKATATQVLGAADPAIVQKINLDDFPRPLPTPPNPTKPSTKRGAK